LTTEQTLAAMEAEIPRLRRYARYLARDADRADDLVQDCLLRAIARLDSWRVGSDLRAWLFTILRNGHISAIRTTPQTTALEAAGDAPELAVSGGYEAHIHLGEVARALSMLSSEHRDVLHLVAMQGLHYEQAADVLDLPVGTVRSRLSRARSELRRRLE